MSISVADVEYVARLARLELSEAEKNLFAGQMGAILGYVEKLKELDQVAYVRFASVYKSFQDLDEFTSEMKSLK